MNWLLLSSVLLLPTQTKPNVIIIMSDDHGYGDLSCHGNKIFKTPNLDKLHSQSVRLTNFHVDPTCAPTRAALMTGRYSSRSGVWHTIMGRSIMRRDETTMADHFTKAGYQTGIFGKWHLGDSYPYRPMDRGFGESLVLGGGGVGQTPDSWGNTYFDDTYWRKDKPEKQKGYCTDAFTSAAIEFIDKNRTKPFFVYLPTNAAHAPYNVAAKYSKPFRDKKIPDARARFYGMIVNLDENVGRLLKKLDDWKLANNTVVVFLTDNGTAEGWDGGKSRGFNAGMRGTKGAVYEGGHRVPCFIRWPGKYKPQDVPQLTAHIDLLPTLLDVCGIQAKHTKKLDGMSLRPLLEGKKGWKPRTLLVHSQRIEKPEKWRQCAVMTDRWRLINGKELFDLTKDPGQRKDVASDHAAVVKELRAAYETWYTSISRRFGEYCELVLGSDKQNPVTLNCHDWHCQMVPWHQRAVKNFPKANGFWAVEIEKAGTYRFTLRHQPPEAKCPLRAVKARVKVGDVEQSAVVAKGSTEVVIDVTLKAGKGRLQTWLEEKDGTSRGAFFVEVRRIK